MNLRLLLQVDNMTIDLWIRLLSFEQLLHIQVRGCRGRDRMVVGFTNTYAISAYHHWCCGFDFRSGRCIQHYVIKFLSNLRQVGGFLRILRFPPTGGWFSPGPPVSSTNKTHHHDITEILLKVALSTIKQANKLFKHSFIISIYVFSGTCGGHFTSLTGSIVSPNYPGDYPNNADCRYTIIVPVDHYIILSFQTFNTESGYDYVKVRNIRYIDIYLSSDVWLNFDLYRKFTLGF